MSLWIERQEVTGPALHALIIGVSDYARLPATSDEFPPIDTVTLGLTKLKTPAAGAFRVAKWLASERCWHPTVKVKTIRLLLSPSTEEQEKELGGLAEMPPRATAENVQRAVDDWKKSCKNNRDGVALLYVAGHGILWDTTYESVILLEDFGSPNRFLNQTIDVERTRRGMMGPGLPATQYYFADACKVNPDEVGRWPADLTPGTPIYLAEPKNSAVICAPLYSAAYPGQTAKGYRGEGTYFAQALVECLEGYAWTPPNSAPKQEIEKYFRITPGGLAESLQERITEIAGRHEEDQTILVGEYPPRLGVLSAIEGHPVAPFILRVDPDSAAQGTDAELYDEKGEPVFPGESKKRSCYPPPLKEENVRVGAHSLTVSPVAPLKPDRRSVVVRPYEGWSGTITLR